MEEITHVYVNYYLCGTCGERIEETRRIRAHYRARHPEIDMSVGAWGTKWRFGHRDG